MALRGGLDPDRHVNKESNVMKTNKPTNKDLDNKAMSGADKHLASLTSITVGGTAYTVPTLKAVFQADIDATNAADAAGTQWKEQVIKAQAMRAQSARVRRALRAYLIGLYGAEAVGILEDFGFSPPKPPGPKTVGMKAQGVERAAATRKARHTMGKNQKKAVKGTITTIVTEPASPVSPPAPAPVASAPTQGASGGTAPHTS
jgi:hypothetical protein